MKIPLFFEIQLIPHQKSLAEIRSQFVPETETGRGLIMAGRGEAGASYDGASWGEAGRGEATTGRSGAWRDNDLTKRGEAGRGFS